MSCYLTVHFMLIKYTFGSKSQTLRMRYPFQSTGRPISHRNGWSFRVYMIPLRDFVPEWNSRPGARTGVNSRRADSRRHNILWWYHVNKYRAMRGNRSELAPGRKSPRSHVNTPLLLYGNKPRGFRSCPGDFLSASDWCTLWLNCFVNIWRCFASTYSVSFGTNKIKSKKFIYLQRELPIFG